MKYFLVVAICIEGLCQNFVTTEPQFDSYQACEQFSHQAVRHIHRSLPDSSGSTYCLTQQQILDLAEDLIQQDPAILQDLDTKI